MALLDNVPGASRNGVSIDQEIKVHAIGRIFSVLPGRVGA